MNCNESQTVPSAGEYFSEIDPFDLVLTASMFAVTIVTCCMSFFNFQTRKRLVSDEITSGLLCWLAALFPVTSILAFLGLCIPRSIPVQKSFIDIYLARVLFVYVFLVRHLFGGFLEQKRKLKNNVKLNTPPCCCCICVPRIRPTRLNLYFIEWLTWQAGLIRPVLHFVTLVLYADTRGNIPEQLKKTIDIVGAISGLVAIYGTNIVANMARKPLKDYCVYEISRFLQFTLLFENIQPALLRLLVYFDVVQCNHILPANIRVTLWGNVALICEMLLLAFLARFVLRPQRCALFDLHKSRADKYPDEIEQPFQQESITI